MHVERVDATNQEEMVRFLQHYEDWSLLLLSNFLTYGYRLTERLNSGNFHLIRQSNTVIAAFCLTRRGNLLIQTEVNEPIFSLLFGHCQDEGIPLRGLLGEWDFCHSYWRYLRAKRVIRREKFYSKERLYRIDVQTTSYAEEPGVRLLEIEDFPDWRRARMAYREEMQLPEEIDEDRLRKEFVEFVEQKSLWGYFIKRELACVGAFIARAFDLGLVGEVYTAPQYRRRGLAKALMRHMIRAAKNALGMRKLLIFTGNENRAARELYEHLPRVEFVGFYALFFGL